MESDTRSRKIVLHSALALCAISIVAFVTANSIGSDYVWRLAIWFCIWLTGLHAIYACISPLSVSHVRKMDYFYLGIAAVGIVVGTSSYDEKRGVYYSQLNIRLINQSAEGPRAALDDQLKSFLRLACQSARAFPEYCEKATALTSVLASKVENQQMISAFQGFASFVSGEEGKTNSFARDEFAYTGGLVPIGGNRDLSRYHLYDPTSVITTQFSRTVEPQRRIQSLISSRRFELPEKVALLSEARRVVSSARNMEPFWIQLIATQPLQPRSIDQIEATDLIIALGQAVLWPFILAMAFAVRITKVTIEVLDWPVRIPTALPV